MTDAELKVVIDINKSLGNINSTLNILNDTTQNLTEVMNKQSADVGLVNQKISFLKETIDKIEATMTDIKEEVYTLTRQMDYKETSEMKKKIITDQIKQEKKPKNGSTEPKTNDKITQKDIWAGVKLFLINSKWILGLLLWIVAIILLAKNLINWNDVASIFKGQVQQVQIQEKTGE